MGKIDKYVLNFSGGKDSLATLLLVFEKQLPLDYVIYVDLGIDFPQIKPFIEKVVKQEIEPRGVKFVLLEGDFMKYFLKYGWPKQRWCTGIKRDLIDKFLKSEEEKFGDVDVIWHRYIGYAYDEEKRYLNLKKQETDKNKYYAPLYGEKITEKDALNYCLAKGYDFNGLYEHRNRISCFACPNQSLGEIRRLMDYYPELWERIKEMEKMAREAGIRNWKFKNDKSTEDLEKKYCKGIIEKRKFLNRGGKMEEIKITYVSVDELKDAEYNPRKATAKEYDGVLQSVAKFGIVDPIIVNSAENRKNVVIGGHLRLKIAKELGIKEVPVVYVNIPDIEREKELNLRLNKNTGSWDWDLLVEFDVDLLLEVGFDWGEIQKKLDLDGGDEIKPEVEFTEELMEEYNYVVLFFDNSVDWLQAQTVLGIKKVKALDSKDGFKRMGIGRVINGKKFLDMLIRCYEKKGGENVDK